MKKEKISELLRKIKECLETGNYKFSKHALERRKERFISLPDILEVLRHGYHEKTKDVWNEQFNEWDYAVRGKTVDQASCRIIVSFDAKGLLIITVIRLD